MPFSGGFAGVHPILRELARPHECFVLHFDSKKAGQEGVRGSGGRSVFHKAPVNRFFLPTGRAIMPSFSGFRGVRFATLRAAISQATVTLSFLVFVLERAAASVANPGAFARAKVYRRGRRRRTFRLVDGPLETQSEALVLGTARRGHSRFVVFFGRKTCVFHVVDVRRRRAERDVSKTGD